MAYQRPKYDANTPMEEVGMMFSAAKTKIPEITDYPIDVRENFFLAAERNHPKWVPISTTDMQNVGGNEVTNPPKPPAEGEAPPMMWGSKEMVDFTDDFGCVWTFVPSAGGPMLKPNHPPVVTDITKWETQVTFPDLSKNDYVAAQEYFVKNTLNPNKVTHINIGQSCTERLVALMGGYTQALMAMAEEPEAVKDFLMAFADFTIKSYDNMTQLWTPDFVTYHDDWGTERDSFFSEKMMEDIVYDPHKKIISHIKGKGRTKFELHCCGNIKRFVPYMIDLGIDFMQIQRRANDMPAFKEKWGDKIGMNVQMEGIEMRGATPPTKEALFDAIHRTVDMYAPGGGIYTSVYAADPELQFDATMELYYYSRELYDRENA